MHQHLELSDAVRSTAGHGLSKIVRTGLWWRRISERSFGVVVYRAVTAHPSPKDSTLGVLLFIAFCMSVADQKQRPTTSL